MSDAMDPPASLGHEGRDVADIAAAILEDVYSDPKKFESIYARSVAIDEFAFLVRVPDGSIEGANALLQILRLAVDAAVVAFTARELQVEVTDDFVAQVLAERRVELTFVSAGTGSFWGCVRATLKDPRVREVGGAILSLLAAGLGIIAAVVGSGGAGLPLTIAATAPAVVQAAWVLAIRPNPDVVPERLESIGRGRVSDGSSIDTAVGPMITIGVRARGSLVHVLSLRDHLRGTRAEICEVDVWPPITDQEADLRFTIVGSIDFGVLRSVAERDFKVRLGDPRFNEP